MTPLITLRSSLLHMPHGLSRIRAAIKLTLRALTHRRQTSIWLTYLNANPMFSELVQACPHLVHKIYRPYLSNTLNCQQRMEALMAHYGCVFKQGWGGIAAQAARAPVQLCSLTGKSGASYQIQLSGLDTLEREGELVLQLLCGPDLVYSVAFSFLLSNQRLALAIGCLQGPQGDDGLSRIREATREWHGLRPKNLMVRLVRQLGHDTGCQDLILVSNGNRAVRNSMRKGKVHADYDTLWQELGATQRADGDFQLACENLPEPVMEEIASHKRSQARKRYQLVASVLQAIQVRLQEAQCAALPSTLQAQWADKFDLPPGMELEAA